MPRLYLHLTLLVLLALPAEAIVFSMRPGNGARSLEDALKLQAVLTEAVTVNGQATEMQVSVADGGLAEVLQRVAPLLANYKHIANTNSVLIETDSEQNPVTRYYLLDTGTDQRTLVFRLVAPRAALTREELADWPAELPRPRAETVGPVLRFTKRSAICAMFTSTGSAEATAMLYATALAAGGWRRLEGPRPDSGTFIDADGKRLVMVSATPTENGCRAIVVLTTTAGLAKAE